MEVEVWAWIGKFLVGAIIGAFIGWAIPTLIIKLRKRR